jgi:hypothetical protein
MLLKAYSQGLVRYAELKNKFMSMKRGLRERSAKGDKKCSAQVFMVFFCQEMDCFLENDESIFLYFI